MAKNLTSDDYVEKTHYAPTVRFYISRPALRFASERGAYPAWVMNALGGFPETISPTIDVAGKTIAGTFLDLLPADFEPPHDLPWPDYREAGGERHW